MADKIVALGKKKLSGTQVDDSVNKTCSGKLSNCKFNLLFFVSIVVALLLAFSTRDTNHKNLMN